MANKLLLVAVALCLATSFVFAVDFSGTWTLNKDKSNAGEGRGRFMSTKLVVTQDAAKIKIERTGQGRDGEVTREEALTLDGKENDVEGMRGNVRKVTATWAEGNKELNITSVMKMERDGNMMEMTTTEVWKMDGTNLVIDAVMNSPRGERKSKLVYEKAK